MKEINLKKLITFILGINVLALSVVLFGVSFYRSIPGLSAIALVPYTLGWIIIKVGYPFRMIDKHI
jgi:hypothetical protein